MDQINDMELRNKEMNDLRNTTTAKLRILDRCKQDAKEECLHKIFSDIYKDAVPFNDEYKNAYGDTMCNDFPDFIKRNYPEGLTLYVHECLKKGSPFAKRIMEAVEDLVNDEYNDKEINIDDIDHEDLIFKTTDDIQKKLDVIKDDLQANDISQAIRDNVKQSVISEIRRAKEEKQAIKSFEDQLKNDPAMTTPAAIESAIADFNASKGKFYTPTLFEAVMISKVNELTRSREIGEFVEMPLYNVMSEFKENADEISLGDYAFIEAVKEYTCLNMLKALKMESYTKNDIDRLITMYSESK